MYGIVVVVVTVTLDSTVLQLELYLIIEIRYSRVATEPRKRFF